jgi:hypothetical protein
MKMNWGKGIVIAIALFMCFILYFVVKVQSDSQYDNEMVTEDYYRKEKLVQGNIESITNANNLKEKVTIVKTVEGLKISFPQALDYSKVKGKVSLYRPSNQKLDFETSISLSGLDLLIPKKNLVDGHWDITIAWEYEGKSYLNKEEIYF